MAEITPTRSALLELRDEQNLMREGHAFLDEKRVLLANEIVKQLHQYQSLRARFDTQYREAGDALQRALVRHGLQGLQTYPPAEATADLAQHRRGLLGVSLLEARLDVVEGRQSQAELATPEGEQAKTQFRVLLEDLARLAAVTGNLWRLYHEYQRTERRARALEDVIIPELGESITQITDVLEAQELEEAIRVRSRKSD